MKIKIELYGSKMGNNQITEAFLKNEFKLLLTLKDDTHKIEVILSAEEARQLQNQVTNAFDKAKETGFKVL